MNLHMDPRRVLLFLAAITSVWQQTFSVPPETSGFPPACCFPHLAVSLFIGFPLFQLLLPLTVTLLHLPLVNPAKATKHTDDLFMLGKPSSPLTTISLSLSHTHIHTLPLSSCVCLSVKLYVTVMLNGTSSLLLWWVGMCRWQSLQAQHTHTHFAVSYWAVSLSLLWVNAYDLDIWHYVLLFFF